MRGSRIGVMVLAAALILGAGTFSGVEAGPYPGGKAFLGFWDWHVFGTPFFAGILDCVQFLPSGKWCSQVLGECGVWTVVSEGESRTEFEMQVGQIDVAGPRARFKASCYAERRGDGGSFGCATFQKKFTALGYPNFPGSASFGEDVTCKFGPPFPDAPGANPELGVPSFEEQLSRPRAR